MLARLFIHFALEMFPVESRDTNGGHKNVFFLNLWSCFLMSSPWGMFLVCHKRSIKVKSDMKENILLYVRR